MQLFLKVSVFNVWLPKKGKKRKMKWRKIKGTGSLNTQKVTSARGGGAYSDGGNTTTMAALLFAFLRSEAVISDQSTGPWYLEVRAQFVPTFASASYVQAVPGTHAEVPAKAPGVGE